MLENTPANAVSEMKYLQFLQLTSPLAANRFAVTIAL